MPEAQIRRIGDSQDQLGESPCWHAGAGALCWIDAIAGTLQRLWVGTGEHERHSLPAPVGAIAPCESGALVVALQHGFARYDFALRRLHRLAEIDIRDPAIRLNDGKCDPWGNFIAGTMQVGHAPGQAAAGAIYRLRPDRSVETIAEGFSLVNGPCFSPDGRTFYVADSLARTIWAYDYAPDAPLANQRVFVQTERFDSGPDGATVDSAGFLWSALPRAGQLARFAPDGTLDRLLDVPATYPTSLCFGGPRFEAAYLTSISKSFRLTGTRPQDGGLFELRGLPAPGLAPHRFADGVSTRS
jgi:sugar lactone lactonase YvrE